MKTPQNTNKPEIILTGDRATGPLHLGHYVGSLQQRTSLQHIHDQTILVADMQGLTDNAHNPAKVSSNILNVVADYLAVGIDPTKPRFASNHNCQHWQNSPCSIATLCLLLVWNEIQPLKVRFKTRSLVAQFQLVF
ncbi:hypothetical protein [Vibrio sp. 624788]|uniref:hypothetical protein n=1 Tax=Vibrio sp. 624788 TaxID=1234362 RepID=UPI001F4C53BA|nr:hypothetical protein [Vibrio sp. 624788]